jgi:hypothetical protein
LLSCRNKIFNIRISTLEFEISLPAFGKFRTHLYSIEPANPNGLGQLPRFETGYVAEIKATLRTYDDELCVAPN